MKKFLMIILVISLCTTSVFASSNSLYRSLPEDYIQVEFIESSGDQYIDTGFVLNQDSKLELSISHLNTDVPRKIFGSQTTATSSSSAMHFMGVSSNSGSLLLGVFKLVGYQLSYDINGDEFLDISVSKDKLKINDSELTVSVPRSFSTSENAYLFNVSGNISSNYSNACMRLYSCKIYDNDLLVRDFVPCYRKSDNEAGLFDLVNNQFYSNVGTGVFSIGSEIVNPNSPVLPDNPIFPDDPGSSDSSFISATSNGFKVMNSVITGIMSNPVLLFLLAASLIPVGIALFKALKNALSRK